MRSYPVSSSGPARGAAVLALAEAQMLQDRLLNVFLATTILGLVTILVYLNQFTN